MAETKKILELMINSKLFKKSLLSGVLSSASMYVNMFTRGVRSNSVQDINSSMQLNLEIL